jgi:hypothetical protein
VIAPREVHLADRWISTSRATAPEIPACNVARDVDPAGRAFTLDRIRRGHDRELGHVGEPHMPASRVFR